MLTSFQIENFRAFRHLQLPKLGHVNLIVGRNNTGKTMLLEALRLYASQGQTEVIRELLRQRDEFDRTTLSNQPRIPRLRFESLFHNRQISDKSHELLIGLVDAPQSTLRIRPVWLYRGTASVDWQLIESRSDVPAIEVSRALGLAVKCGESPDRIVPPEPRAVSREILTQGDGTEEVIAAASYIHAKGVHSQTIASWWDAVTLTDAEERILQCLRIIAPVQRVSVIGGRTFMLKLEGESDPVPLRSLGDGVRKMFEFALGLEAARNGKPLLIDEIENGIHYSVQEDLWRFIIEAARRANVQVFATTHSWDCVMAFQSVIAAQPDIEAVGIRLFRHHVTEEIKAVILDRNDLAIATRDQVDFR